MAPTAPIQVEIWSDLVCPWCYVGTRRFERAVAETGIDVDVVYRSFELDPTVPTGERRVELAKVAGKYAEQQRIAVRNIRRDARKHLEAAEKATQISANELERAEKEMEKITHDHVEMIDKALGRKEQELLEV